MVQSDASPANQNLSNDTLPQVVKEIIVRHLIDGSLRDDAQQGITTGVQIMDLQDNHTIMNRNQNGEQYAASLNKLPVAFLVLQDLRAGKLSLNQQMTWQASDVRAGYGVYDQPGAPLSATLGDVLFDMLNHSGNTAVRILVNSGLGGAASVNARWAAYPQLNHTALQPLDANRFYLGNTAPSDALWSLEQLMQTTDQYSSFMKNALATNIFTDFGVRSQLAGNDWIVLVNKVGILDDPTGDNRHDVGIIYNTRSHKSYGYALLTTSPEENPSATPQAEQSLKDMGLDLLRFAGDRPASHATPFATPNAARTPEKKVLY